MILPTTRNGEKTIMPTTRAELNALRATQADQFEQQRFAEQALQPQSAQQVAAQTPYQQPSGRTLLWSGQGYYVDPNNATARFNKDGSPFTGQTAAEMGMAAQGINPGVGLNTMGQYAGLGSLVSEEQRQQAATQAGLQYNTQNGQVSDPNNRTNAAVNPGTVGGASMGMRNMSPSMIPRLGGEYQQSRYQDQTYRGGQYGGKQGYPGGFQPQFNQYRPQMGGMNYNMQQFNPYQQGRQMMPQPQQLGFPQQTANATSSQFSRINGRGLL